MSCDHIKIQGISMRIRGASTDMEKAGLDTEGMAESTAKLRQEVMALSGVDIMKNENVHMIFSMNYLLSGKI